MNQVVDSKDGMMHNEMNVSDFVIRRWWSNSDHENLGLICVREWSLYSMAEHVQEAKLDV